jgi:AcrR family transcriptional regulator
MTADHDESTRDRVLSAAARITGAEGWAAVTMGRVATEAGVSRQTVHTLVGTKAGLGEAMVAAELARFLAVVQGAFDAHPRDLRRALEAAIRGVLERAAATPLLRAVVTATHGADTELLPLLTTDAGFVLDTARAVVGERLAAYTSVDARSLAAATDVLVRVTLSHVMAPSETPRRTATALAAATTTLLT